MRGEVTCDIIGSLRIDIEVWHADRRISLGAYLRRNQAQEQGIDQRPRLPKVLRGILEPRPDMLELRRAIRGSAALDERGNGRRAS